MKLHAFLCTLSLTAMILSAPAVAGTIYVDDDNTGGPWDGSEANPYQYIQDGITNASPGDTVIVKDGTYTGAGNKDLDFGGKAITLQSENGADVTIIDCEGAGRGFHFQSGETAAAIVDGFTIRNGSVTGGGGGAIRCENLSSPTITNCVIAENSADWAAGIYCGDGNPTISNCVITGNKAAGSGGGIYCGGGHTVITGCTISNNITATHGGGIKCMFGDNATISDCVISGNGARDNFGGGGVFLYSAGLVTIEDCTFHDNWTYGAGGAVRCAYTDAIITGCRVENNRAGSYGGGIDLYGGDAAVTNCIIKSNVAAKGAGGIQCALPDSPTITNCTITDNRAPANGGGIFCDDNNSPTITNSIIYGNTGGELVVDSATPTVTYCDVQGGWPGTGNIDADPMLSADGHLRTGSPCNGTGTAVAAPADDIDGEARPYPPAGAVDMGADEFVDTDTDGMPDWYEDTYGLLKGDPSDAGLDKDGDTFTNLAEYEEHGTNPDEADTDGDGRDDGQELTDGTNPLHPDNAAMTYYVNGATGSDTYDGMAAAWDGTHGPKATIQAGINATAPGLPYTVFVADGTYTGIGNRDMNFRGRAITVRSENGASACIIDCENAGGGFAFRLAEGLDSVLDGFTITNGIGFWTGLQGDDTHNGGAVFCRRSSPTIQDCTITGNSTESEGGGIWCYQSSPSIIDCTISDNVALPPYAEGGGIFCFAESSPTITRCTISGNTSAKSGGGIYCRFSCSPVISDCVIADNSTGYNGGAILLDEDSAPIMTNCMILGNTASQRGGGMACYGSAPTLANCTVAYNDAGTAGSAITCGSSGDRPTLTNCIVWGDMTQQVSGGPIVAYCNIKGGTGEVWFDPVTCIEADPLLGPEGLLRSGSPCIDWCPSGPAQDVEGDARPVDIPGVGYDDPPDARTYDIGADEFVDTDGDGLPDWWEQEHFGSPLAADAGGDEDFDGLTNLGECQHGANPWVPDTDGDGRNDGQEVAEGTNPVHPDNVEKTYYVNVTLGDDGHDGLASLYDGTHGPKATIQAGIDVSPYTAGYTVLVADGTYTGGGNKDIQFMGRPLTVCSAHGAGACSIDCEGAGRAFYLRFAERSDSVIEGFAIRNGNVENGGGIAVDYSSPTIANCTVTDCYASGNGGGMYCWSSSPTITDCTITDCTADGNGGGAYCSEGSPVIINCTISSNTGGPYPAAGGGISWANNCALSIIDSTISDNEAGWCGGGLYADDDCTATITGCTISGNSSSIGGGIKFRFDVAGPVTNCAIIGNTATYIGGGMSCSGGNGSTITNCTFAGNSAATHAGSISYTTNAMVLTDCILWGNTPEELYPDSETADLPTVTYCDVQGGAGEAWFDPVTCIDQDPLFVHGPLHDYYLSQLAAGQGINSPCVDAGSDTAGNLGLDALTTRTDGVGDAGVVDMGYHAAPAIFGDVDGNGVVDGLDLAAVLSAWECVPGDPLWNPAADLDGNGVVDGLDLTEVIANWTE